MPILPFLMVFILIYLYKIFSLTCQGSDMYNCLACNESNYRKINLDYCVCNDHYYDDEINSLCQPCHYSWLDLNLSLNV